MTLKFDSYVFLSSKKLWGLRNYCLVLGLHRVQRASGNGEAMCLCIQRMASSFAEIRAIINGHKNAAFIFSLQLFRCVTVRLAENLLDIRS